MASLTLFRFFPVRLLVPPINQGLLLGQDRKFRRQRNRKKFQKQGISFNVFLCISYLGRMALSEQNLEASIGRPLTKKGKEKSFK